MKYCEKCLAKNVNFEEILTPLLIFLAIVQKPLDALYEAEKIFIEKPRKFPFETYIVLNKKNKI